MTALDQVPCGKPCAGDLVDREGVVGIAAGRLERHVRHVDRQLRERVEHADLRRDHDETLDALRGEVREPRRRSSRRHSTRCSRCSPSSRTERAADSIAAMLDAGP